jgi:pimeloyl-ACP methyl ester carboxylesterase
MDGRPHQHPIRRAVIIIISAVGVSALAAVIIIWFARLTGSTAWAVVAGLVYDRVGTGASTRLADPTEYTTERAVADLEAVRVHTGASRVVLHGHSWGVVFAVAYAQEHPDRVAALVLSAQANCLLVERNPSRVTWSPAWMVPRKPSSICG